MFIGGLIVGRTPEYFGKKIGAREVKRRSPLLTDTVAVLPTESDARGAGRGSNAIVLR